MSIWTMDGDFHPVVYLSKTFDTAERNYDVHDKELTAINAAFKHWHHYLEGSGTLIDVVTDHCNLQYFLTMKSPNVVPSMNIGVPLTVQPHYLFPSR